ncbi:TonB-dependent receptor [Sphingomonas psychrotolerans]|uniref:TonB-dependent receptor n=1 Tax=Sphingomonas psychrotolerans TaxID=1327635 RepID=A0ABU3N9A1_9SPHN|nr:TonB-dependent receptor [Sphingomonas psychrotolerans]MDT8761062.1 TonB-dependent receptor [Sphingomonas psychrotolerans]
MILASTSLLIVAGAAPAFAQTDDAATAQTDATAAAADASAQDTAEQDIVVTGLRRSLETSQRIKRESEGIVDAIVAEDIGKLPDTFASSALQRVPGVNVTRGGGESAGVTVRGLPDLTTTYNGRQIFTAEGRFVAIQDFPAGTVAALEVFKSGLANQVEGGIAGAVNVRGRKPFDFNGFELSGSLNYVHSEQAQREAPNGNLLISDRWNTGIGEMGLLVNASYVGIEFLDSTREQSLVIGSTNQAFTDRGRDQISNYAPGAAVGLRFPDAQGNFLGYGKRWRPSANAAFQWKPTPDLEIYVDGLFQGFRSEDYNRWMFIPIFGAAFNNPDNAPPLTLTNITTVPGTNQIASMTVTNANRPDGYAGSFNGHTDTYQGGGGLIWTRDRLRVSADVAYTDSQYTTSVMNVDYAMASSPVRNVVFNAEHDGGPTQTFVNFNINDPANYISRGLWQERLKVNGKDWQARTDLSYDLDLGFLKRIDVGVRYTNRKAGRDLGNLYINNEGARIPLTSLPGLDVRSTQPGFQFNNVQPNVFFATPTRDSIRDNITQLRTFFGVPAGMPPYNPAENFRANEKSYAAYAQLKYGFDLGGPVVDGVIGLRGVKTKLNIDGFSRVVEGLRPDGSEIVSFPAVSADSEYTDWLPNASARIGFTDKLQARLAYTQTRTRPSFFDLRPNTSLGQPVILPPGDPCIATPTTPECVERLRRGGSAGNPNLKPLTSDNYDLSLEYYFSRTGSFTAAVFRHDAEGFLATVDDRSQPGLRIARPVNLGQTRLQGAEVTFTSFLDIEGLPEWMKGFGLQANGTYIDAKGDLTPNLAASLNNEQQAFPGVSKWSYNLVALYEKPQFSARLAYNYRSSFVNYYSLEALDPTTHAVKERGRGQLDFSTSITPIPNITLAFDIVNVLGNPLQRDRQYNLDGDSYARQILYLERSYSLGVRFRF